MEKNINKNFIPGLVSVIVPTYNRADIILETLNSVRFQTYRPVELIIIDDGSTDNTAEFIKKWEKLNSDDKSFRVNYFKQKNSGASSARNFGIAKSNGEFIQFLDSDDLLNPFKIEKQLKCSILFDSTVYSDCRRFSIIRDGVLLYPLFTINRSEVALKDWFEGRFIPPCAFLWRRKDVQLNGFWNENLSLDDDGEFARRFLLKGGKWSFCSGALSYYRMYPDLRSRQSAVREIEALKTLTNVLEETEKKLVELDLLEKNKKSFAICYWNLAKYSAFEPEIMKFAIDNYKRLDPTGKIPENKIDIILYCIFGIKGRKIIIDFIHRFVKIQPFKVVAKVKNISAMMNFDLRELN
jgi:glycosyltransferase involved in cell wall biosynthesis